MPNEMIDLGGSVGEALFDDIFSGPDGVTATLTDMAGAAAKLIYPGSKGTYNPTTDEYEDEEPTKYCNVPWVDDTATYSNGEKTHVGGIMVEGMDVVGIVSADKIPIRIDPGNHKIELDGKTYNIKAVETQKSGYNAAFVRILCGL